MLLSSWRNSSQARVRRQSSRCANLESVVKRREQFRVQDLEVSFGRVALFQHSVERRKWTFRTYTQRCVDAFGNFGDTFIPANASAPISGGRFSYRAAEADRGAWGSALRPKPCLLALHRKLRNIVASKLKLDWSPDRVSGSVKARFPDDESMRVSHETIYRSLFIQARAVLKKELMGHLRSKRSIRSCAARYLMPSPSESVPQSSRTERFPATGRGI